jgi:hypothetical protein
MKLTGQKNQCRGCGKYFQSNHAFDKHRTGSLGTPPSGGKRALRGTRRCLSETEMLAAGMVLKASGFWAGSIMPDTAYTYVSVEKV